MEKTQYNKLHKSQRINLNNFLFKIWDLWKPNCINSNCGKVHRDEDFIGNWNMIK